MINRAGFLLRRLACLALLFSGALATANSQDAATLDQIFPRSSLQIATPDARLHTFDVWVADTDARRQRGLMFVKALDENTGMLFIYPNAHSVAMWMKNTYIPLDMLFVREDGRVEQVVRNTVPLSEKTIECKTPVIAVLELKAGTADKLKIGPGARLQHDFFTPPQ
jgi:uncharacterized membrane protein (UPF0127 family)